MRLGSQTTGGRNGYGAKLANIYSNEFIVETCDGAGSGRRYKQVRLVEGCLWPKQPDAWRACSSLCWHSDGKRVC